MNHVPNRRDFLRSTTLGAGILVLSPWVRAQTPESLLRTPAPDPDRLIAVARQALDAARSAGASDADVRILTGARMRWDPVPDATASVNEAERNHLVGQPVLQHGARIGLRVWVDGHMGFAGNMLSFDADQTAALAKLAVQRAKAWKVAGQAASHLAAAPVVENGQWQTPIQIDPFTVPIGEQEGTLLEAMQAVRHTPTTAAISLSLYIEWKRIDELFASSTGSLLRQRLYSANHTGGFWAREKAGEWGFVSIQTGDLGGSRGYEGLKNLKQKLAAATQTAEEVRSLPWRPIEAGSYDVVLSPRAAAQLVASTIGHPLELDRALLRTSSFKEYATSYAVPPNEAIGRFEIGNELLNVRADRSRPGLAATVGWDAEGVKASEFALVQGGVLQNYLSDRSTAAALKPGYERLGQPVQSTGCASDGGGLLPKIKLPNLALLPGSAAISQGDLIKDVKNGYLIDDLYPSADHTGLNVQARAQHVRHIRNGALGDVIQHVTLQFNTPRFWQGLDALGGAATVATHHHQLDERHLEKLSHVSITAPAIRVRKVNMVNTGRRGRRSD